VPSLAFRTWGSGPPLVLCHGFTQTSALWGPFGQALGQVATVIAVDMPGHGASSDLSMDLAETADALCETIGEQPFDLLGYSMGGRCALLTALRHPGAVRRLVLIGATAGIDDAVARTERIRRDEELADGLEASGDVDAFLSRWLAQPMFARLSADVAGIEARRTSSARGLSTSLRKMGTGAQPPMWDRVGSITAPTLLLAGARDTKFAEIAIRLAHAMENASMSLIPGAGHACHLEAPVRTAATVVAWLKSTDPHAIARPAASSAPTVS